MGCNKSKEENINFLPEDYFDSGPFWETRIFEKFENERRDEIFYRGWLPATDIKTDDVVVMMSNNEENEKKDDDNNSTDDNDQNSTKESIALTYDTTKFSSPLYTGFKALVFIVHGLHEHSGRYADLAHNLTQKGYICYAMDFYAHGKSPGLKGDIQSFENLVDDLIQFIRLIRPKYNDIPAFICAHSMGTLATTLAMRKIMANEPKDYIRAVVYSGCALVPGPSSASPLGLSCLFCLTRFEKTLASLANCLARIDPLGPNSPIFQTALTHDDKIVDIVTKDPLHNRGRILNRTAATLVQSLKEIKLSAPQFNLPILIIHGEDDTIALPKGSQLFYDLISSNEKEIKLYSGFFHEIYNEKEKDQPINDTINFFENHLILKKENNKNNKKEEEKLEDNGNNINDKESIEENNNKEEKNLEKNQDDENESNKESIKEENKEEKNLEKNQEDENESNKESIKEENKDGEES